MKLFLSLLLLLANGFAAQSTSLPEKQEKQIDAFTRENNAKRAQNPDGLVFTVRVKDNRKQFYPGELIELELSFAALKSETFTVDDGNNNRSGLLELDDFIVDRPDAVVDPLHDYYNSGLYGFNGGGQRPAAELTHKPYLISAELNEWRRFDKPGQYRLYVVSDRVGKKGASGDPSVSAVVSNIVEFEILRFDKKWANQKLNEATTALSKTDNDHHSAWLSDPEKLKRLRALCLTYDSRNEVDRIIRDWNYQIYVGLNPFDDEPYSISVAHYQLKSLDSLKEKLLQFPKGTTLKWRGSVRSDDTKAQEVFQQLKNYLDEHGMKLERDQ